MKKYAGDLMVALEGITSKVAKMESALERNESNLADVAGDLKTVLDALKAAAVPASSPPPQAVDTHA